MRLLRFHISPLCVSIRDSHVYVAHENISGTVIVKAHRSLFIRDEASFDIRPAGAT